MSSMAKNEFRTLDDKWSRADLLPVFDGFFVVVAFHGVFFLVIFVILQLCHSIVVRFLGCHCRSRHHDFYTGSMTFCERVEFCIYDSVVASIKVLHFSLVFRILFFINEIQFRVTSLLQCFFRNSVSLLSDSIYDVSFVFVCDRKEWPF